MNRNDLYAVDLIDPVPAVAQSRGPAKPLDQMPSLIGKGAGESDLSNLFQGGVVENTFAGPEDGAG